MFYSILHTIFQVCQEVTQVCQEISPIWEVPRTFMHLTKPGNKEKRPPWPQLLKDTVNVHVRKKYISAAP